jgi:ATP-dependent Lon protease
MGYRYPDENGPGKIKLVSFSNFCPYEVDLDFYKDIRKEFTIDEWIDVLLGAIDYNPKGYENHLQKMTMLTRLLPFIEKRLNLIELAPKGTGKSYLFGRVSKYSWLSTGGTMTRAKMFYDVSKRAEGLVCNNDYVALDEIQTIDFGNVSEMQGAMKGYMEQGEFTVGTYKGVGDAGIILLGNILQDYMDECGFMLKELPDLFKESALMDRFHGFIKGWDIPRMHDDLKISDWALNSEYFCSIMHLLRNDGTYRAIVDELIDVPERADVRDTEAVKRIATAYLKLLFPNVRNKKDVDLGMFNHYCLKPAKSMRQIIRNQLGHLDPKEYGGKDVPQFKIKAENAN